MSTRIVLAALLAFGCVTPVLAGETVTENDTYEKRSMKTETLPPPAQTDRTIEETETSRIERPRSGTVEERRTIEQPGAVIEKKTEKTETTHHDD
jgi:hypothetical protein